jgi:hypothetical protein
MHLQYGFIYLILTRPKFALQLVRSSMSMYIILSFEACTLNIAHGFVSFTRSLSALRALVRMLFSVFCMPQTRCSVFARFSVSFTNRS